MSVQLSSSESPSATPSSQKTTLQLRSYGGFLGGLAKTTQVPLASRRPRSALHKPSSWQRRRPPRASAPHPGPVKINHCVPVGSLGDYPVLKRPCGRASSLERRFLPKTRALGQLRSAQPRRLSWQGEATRMRGFVATRTRGSRDRALEASVKAGSQSSGRLGGGAGPGRDAALGVVRGARWKRRRPPPCFSFW